WIARIKRAMTEKFAYMCAPTPKKHTPCKILHNKRTGFLAVIPNACEGSFPFAAWSVSSNRCAIVRNDKFLV
ncbi:MAG: hypothetical protein ACPGRX_09740, partial [Bdellovibrionales bacterium]